MKHKFSVLRARMSSESRARADAEAGALLEILAGDIDDRPEILRPINAELTGRLHALVAGVEVDLDQTLPPEVDSGDMH